MRDIICRWKSVSLSFVFFLALVFSVGGPAPCKSGGDAAMITDAVGGGQFQKSGQKAWKAASMMQVLCGGDRVKTGKKSKMVLVFFKDNHREILQGEAQALVGEAGCRLEKGKKAALTKEATPQASRYKVTAAVMPGRMSKMNVIFMKSFGNAPVSLELKSPSVTAASLPEFRWNTVKDADGYNFSLSADTGETVWQKELKTNGLIYPSSAPGLERGRSYFWEVRALKENKILARGSGSFRLVSEADLAEVEEAEKMFRDSTKAKPDDATPYVLLGNVYIQKALYDKAVRLFEKMSAMRPNDLKCHEILADLYHALGDTEKEILEVQKIGKLAK
jgi:tetratricopeptide (TPR) repeat protein